MLIVANTWPIDSPGCAGLRHPRYGSVFTHSGPEADVGKRTIPANSQSAMQVDSSYKFTQASSKLGRDQATVCTSITEGIGPPVVKVWCSCGGAGH